MKDRNICKFVTKQKPLGLSTQSFVYETNTEIMRLAQGLKANIIILIAKGEGHFTFDRHTLDGKASDIIFGFEGERFFVDPGKDLEYIYILFSGDRAEELMARFGINKACRIQHSFERLFPLWKSTITSATAETIDLASESMLLYTFSCFSAISAQNSELLNRLLEITDEHFNDFELSVASISEELAYNSKYISRFFKQKMGVAFSEYLRNLRIKYAVTLFDHGLDSVKNVALLSGYKDPLYFSVVFKNVIGKSPKDYLKKTNNTKSGQENE